jgi:hypothetical protein
MFRAGSVLRRVLALLRRRRMEQDLGDELTPFLEKIARPRRDPH